MILKRVALAPTAWASKGLYMDNVKFFAAIVVMGMSVCSPAFGMTAAQCAAANAINQRVGETISKLSSDVYREMRANAGSLSSPCNSPKPTLTAQQCGAAQGLQRRIIENSMKWGGSGAVYRQLQTHVADILKGAGCR